MRMDIKNSQDQIIAEFEPLIEWFDRYEYLIKLGRSLEPMPEHFKTEENAIPGCQSKVWLKVERAGDGIRFFADSDALITRGIIALLLRVLDRRSPGDIESADLYFIDRIGLSANLSPSRANGVASIVRQMRRAARDLDHP